MDRPHIESLRIQNFGCFTDATIELTPLHALIGPNDSGKSTVLAAARLLTTLAAGPLSEAHDSGKLGAGIANNPAFRFDARIGNDTWVLEKKEDVVREYLDPDRGRGHGFVTINYGSHVLAGTPLHQALAGSRLLRLDPDSLRQPTVLIPEGTPLGFTNALGLGLPAVYDAIIARDLQAFIKISTQLRALFPTVKQLSLKNPSSTKKALGIQLINGQDVSADFMSEGMLYFLAYAALPYLSRTGVILIEEPENGLHPARIREVMRILREISKTTQVLLATHSPLVVNELRSDEVTILTRDSDAGTRATLLKNTPNFEERSEVYSLGELWVSYADGNLETPLFTEPAPTPDPGSPVEWSANDER